MADLTGRGELLKALREAHKACLNAMQMLAEQEPVKPHTMLDGPWSYERCGACRKVLYERGFAYCPWCGRKVNWNAAD